eukprot:UN15388
MAYRYIQSMFTVKFRKFYYFRYLFYTFFVIEFLCNNHNALACT